jgi:hypothetical protein
LTLGGEGKGIGWSTDSNDGCSMLFWMDGWIVLINVRWHHICTFYIAHIGGQFIAFWLWANCVKLLWRWWYRCNILVRAMEMTKLLGKEEQVMIYEWMPKYGMTVTLGNKFWRTF